MRHALRGVWERHLRATPEAESARIVGYDLARSIAISLMILVNFQVFLLDDPTGSPRDGLLRWLAHAPSGRSSSLFVILAGVGIAQMSRRALRSNDAREWWVLRRTLWLRSLFLLVSGGLLITVWYIDILHFYAAYLALAALFVRRKSPTLLVAAFAFVLAGAVLAVVAPEDAREGLEGLTPVGIALNFWVDGIHPIFPWFAFLLYGMWLGRIDLSDGARRRTFFVRALALAVSMELLSTLVAVLATRVEAFSFLGSALGLFATDWTPAPLYVFSAWGTGTCIILAAHEVASRARDHALVRALVSTGQVSLSIYLFHALVGVGIPRWLFHLESALPIEVVVAYWAAFLPLTIVLAASYRRFVRRGPIELVMRALTGSPERSAPLEGPSEPAPRAYGRPSVLARGLVTLLLGLVLASRVVGLAPPRLGCLDAAPLVDVGSSAGELSLLCTHVRIPLEVRSEERVTLATRSGVDVYLELHDAATDALLAQDDDSGPDLDALLTLNLTPGTYVLVVRPYSAVTGPFSVVVERPDARTAPNVPR